MSIHTFSLDDICRAKTIPVEIKDDAGNIEGIVYLKEPSAIEGMKLQESLVSEASWHEIVFGILALTLSDEAGNPLIKSPEDRQRLEAMPPRMLIALRDPSLGVLKLSFTPVEATTSASDSAEGALDEVDIDQTLANLDDQVAAAYTPKSSDIVPVDGNENLHLDQDPGDGSGSNLPDPTNPFVETAEELSSPV